MENEDVRDESRDVVRVDVSSVSRRPFAATCPIVDTESNHWIQNSVTQPLSGWNLPKDECRHLLEIIETFTNFSQEAIQSLSEPYITIIYDQPLHDCEIRVSEGNTAIPVVVYRQHMSEILVQRLKDEKGQTVPISAVIQREYSVGEFYMFTSSEVEIVLDNFGEMVKKSLNDTSMTDEEIRRVVLDELQDKLGRNVEIETNARDYTDSIRVTINGRTSEFKAGDVSTDLLRTLLRSTRNLDIGMGMGMDDLYFEVFEHDDFYFSEGQKADKEIAHRRHMNMRKLDDRIRNINNKIKRETGTKFEFLVKTGDKIRLNSELTRLKKSRK